MEEIIIGSSNLDRHTINTFSLFVVCKYVALYKGLLNNQKVYENSLDDLQLICDTYIEDLIKIEESKLLGEYIERIPLHFPKS
jgi:cob(I)alamin adenosyltransferase